MSTNGLMWNLEYEKAEISRSRSYQLVNKGFTPPPPSPLTLLVLVLVIRQRVDFKKSRGDNPLMILKNKING